MYYNFPAWWMADMFLAAYPNAKIVSTEYNITKAIRINIFMPINQSR